jgi:hypothetical protein
MSEFTPDNPIHAATLLDCDGLPFGHEIAFKMSEGMGMNPRTLAVVALLRARVTTLLESPNETDQQTVQQISAAFRINDQFEFNKAVTGEHAIGERPVLEWLAGVDDATFIKLAQWNVERQRSLQAQLVEDSPELVDLSLEKTIKLINLGLFPADALRRVRLAAKIYAPFQAMDSFEQAAKNATGLFNSYTIRLANLYAIATEQFGISVDLEETTFHELLHGAGEVSGGGFRFNQSSALYSRILEEAFVTHSTEVARSKRADPQIAAIDPAERIGYASFTYSEERRAMALLSATDIANVPPDLWAAAFFSNEDSQARRKLMAKLRGAFTLLDPDPIAFETLNQSYENTWVSQNSMERSRLLAELEKKVNRVRGLNREFARIIESSAADENSEWAVKIPA